MSRSPSQKPSPARLLDYDNRMFVGALLRAFLLADKVPPGWSVPQFRDALQDHGVIGASSGGCGRSSGATGA